MKTIKRVWIKLSSFVNREASITFLFWLIVFLIAGIVRIFGWA
jgi:hypothetical protein